MSTYTNTTARTWIHTTTHLAGAVVGVLSETLLAIGFPWGKVERVNSYEEAIRAWLREKSLARLTITVTAPGVSETVTHAINFDYFETDGEAELRDQLARIRRQLGKEGQVPRGADFNITATPRFHHYLSDQPGWSTRSNALPEAGRSYRYGTAASGPGAAAVLSSYRL